MLIYPGPLVKSKTRKRKADSPEDSSKKGRIRFRRTIKY